MDEVTLYSTTTCGYCTKVKHLFRMKGIEYTEKKVNVDITREQLCAELGKEVRTVPQVVINGEHVGGYQEVREYYGE